MHDLVIQGGTVVDGTGAPARTADITVTDGVITGVGDHRGEEAARTVDADGLLVTPGWVDIHTHYDGQATWDEVLAPSSWHGVTTLVTGNCGVGFAPARPDRHEWLIGLMEGVEDIPGTALSEGMTWDWETFPEYLDALDKRQWTVDVGTQIAHGAVRSYVMGERGARNEPATHEDIAAMKQVVKEAVAAGALGFSTSRTIAHRAIDGEPVPGTYAAEDELFGIGAALGELGTGIFELAPAGTAGEDILAPKEEVDWMRRLSAAIHRPVTFAMVQVDAAPDLWRELMDESLRAVADGADLWPQVAGRGLRPAVRPLHHLLPARPDPRLPGAEGEGALPRTNWSPPCGPPRCGPPSSRGSRTPRRPSGWSRPSRPRTPSAALRSTSRGPSGRWPGSPRPPVAPPCRWPTTPCSRTTGGACCTSRSSTTPTATSTPPARCSSTPGPRPDSATAAPTAASSATRPSPPSCSPTGPATGCGARRLPLEWMVKKQTHDTARLYGLSDRGTLEVGALADINLIDYDRLQLTNPEVVADLPAGGKRLLQGAVGYVETIKSGVTTFAEGKETGARPGTLVRGAR